MRLQAPALPLFCRHAVAAADVFVFVWAAVTAFILIVGQIKVGSNATAATALLSFEQRLKINEILILFGRSHGKHFFLMSTLYAPKATPGSSWLFWAALGSSWQEVLAAPGSS